MQPIVAACIHFFHSRDFCSGQHQLRIMCCFVCCLSCFVFVCCVFFVIVCCRQPRHACGQLKRRLRMDDARTSARREEQMQVGCKDCKYQEVLALRNLRESRDVQCTFFALPPCTRGLKLSSFQIVLHLLVWARLLTLGSLSRSCEECRFNE